ncbi:MAG: transposase [Butyricicoccus sp.]|nr:transposase [Butyricicoccus sp.]
MDNKACTRNTTIKVQLDPTPVQAAFFEKTFACCRYLWNQMLSDQMRCYNETNTHCIPTPTKYKASAPFLKEADSSALVAVHQNLRIAFQRFFKNPSCNHHPVFKSKKRCKNSYTTYCQTYRSGNGASMYLTDHGIRLPKVGIVKARLHRKPLHWWTLKTATVSKTPSGKYHCSLVFAYTERPPQAVQPTQETTLGLNFSLSHFYIDSNGHAANPPHWLAQSQDKLRRMQQRLARMQCGSKNYEQQLRKIERLYEHIANQRKDFIHKESRRIANAWDAVCVKDTNLMEMSQVIRLGNVLDAGYGRFRLCLQYKLERLGKPYIVVDKYFPSAKTCHHCGSVYDALAPLTKRWVCPVCGAVLNRAKNAAQNLRDQGLAQYQDAQRQRVSA